MGIQVDSLEEMCSLMCDNVIPKRRKGMTREEAIKYLKNLLKGREDKRGKTEIDEALEMAIQALEQDTVPFDFELYQAGLMDMPKGMIEVLDKIRAEIEQLPTEKCTETRRIYIDADDFKENVLAIIDKYKAESEEINGNR